MSLVTDILDRLTGIAVVRAELDVTMRHVGNLADRFWDHELRLRMLEQKPLPRKPKGGKVR